MAITNYTTLTETINDWSDRTYSATKLQEFVALAESEFNVMPAFRSYEAETSATLATNSSGIATLPSGFVRMRSVTRDYANAIPLTPVSWARLISMNPDDESGEPVFYAISGTSLKVAPVAEDDFLSVFIGSLSALSTSNETNWLITRAPLAYLFMSLAMSEAYNKNFQEASVWKSQAVEKIEELGIQSDLAQYANAGIELDQASP